MKFFRVESESSHFESLVYKLESMSSHMKFYIFLWHFYAVKWCPTCREMVPDKLKIENGVQCLFNQFDCRFLHLSFFNLDLFVFFTLISKRLVQPCCKCCNFSVNVVLNVRFTTNWMCLKSNTHIYVAQTSRNRMSTTWNLYCCLLLMGVRRGGQNGHLPPPWKLWLTKKNSRKHKISSLIPVSWLNSCNDSMFADMTLTLHKSQFTVLALCSHETAAQLICSFAPNAGC